MKLSIRDNYSLNKHLLITNHLSFIYIKIIHKWEQARPYQACNSSYVAGQGRRFFKFMTCIYWEWGKGQPGPVNECLSMKKKCMKDWTCNTIIQSLPGILSNPQYRGGILETGREKNCTKYAYVCVCAFVTNLLVYGVTHNHYYSQNDLFTVF